MINWRNIETDGYPLDENESYLVTDGNEVSTTQINIKRNYGGTNPKTEFRGWSGDENTYENNECCSGETVFDLIPTHWCPASEINLPEK